MKTFTLKEIKNGVRLGVYEDITSADLEKSCGQYSCIGLSYGVYGMNGGVFERLSDGQICAITARNSNLFRLA